MTAAIFHCSHCNGKMQVVEHLAGQPVICPHCQRQLIMPFSLPSERTDEFPADFAPMVRVRKPNYRRKTSSSPKVFIICGVIAIAGFGLKTIGDYISQNAGVVAGEDAGSPYDIGYHFGFLRGKNDGRSCAVNTAQNSWEEYVSSKFTGREFSTFPDSEHAAWAEQFPQTAEQKDYKRGYLHGYDKGYRNGYKTR
jgi:hypothetical protein